MQFFRDIYHLFFPKICASCKEQLLQNEVTVCLKCRFELPITDFTDETNNKVEKTFFGRLPIIFGTSLFYYKTKGKSQQLIYQLKYNGQQDIGTFLGNWMGEVLKNSKRFPKIDYVVPVPLHDKKLKIRGYNQLTTFGLSISKIIKVPYVDDVLIRKSVTETQTLKQRFDRWKNVQEIFHVDNPNFFNNKHVLLIDDVITTGATLEACAKQILKSDNAKISIATMAYTE
ncbi:phosphoribosyltransferase family protein [Aureibaculum sp. 2210JD6-5]|uniref:ComF family protein n=1 Tax=Aureibaculum sp. 2210JD6-5 TaxID=3103957 RepID=UPI002AAE3A30|nr:phosphoribosyltransferase family protein [Aureibaculum sp. 2210JD6-5]MDY7394141.1 phosphoribosyltransferase family protein [Aureibaculum sp. 2210JD6-5]